MKTKFDPARVCEYTLEELESFSVDFEKAAKKIEEEVPDGMLTSGADHFIRVKVWCQHEIDRRNGIEHPKVLPREQAEKYIKEMIARYRAMKGNKMQDECYFCTRKHLGYAEAFMQEAINGYPLHKWFAVGQLCAAEGEIMSAHPEMGELIREHRVQYMDDMHYKFPTLELIEKVTILAKEIGESENKDDIEYDPGEPVEDSDDGDDDFAL